MDDFRSDLAGDWVRTSVLEKYGTHTGYCVMTSRYGCYTDECTCGWNEIADQLDPARGETNAIADAELEAHRREYNAAVANGLVGKARIIARRFKSK